MPEIEWTLVFSTDDLFRAELMKGLLFDSGIESVTINKKDSAYLVGSIELFVPAENAFRAIQIIKTSEA